MNSLDLINEDIARLEKERSLLIEQKAPIDAALHKLYGEIQKLEAARRELQKDDFVALLNDYNASKELRALLTKRFGGTEYGHGVSTSGYLPETMQQYLRIQMDRGGDVTAIHDFLKEVLPHVKPLSDTRLRNLDGPVKVIDIFEKSLSRNGSYRLVTPDDQTFYIYCGRWGEEGPMTLLDALTHISKHLWIRDPRDED